MIPHRRKECIQSYHTEHKDVSYVTTRNKWMHPMIPHIKHECLLCYHTKHMDVSYFTTQNTGSLLHYRTGHSEDSPILPHMPQRGPSYITTHDTQWILLLPHWPFRRVEGHTHVTAGRATGISAWCSLVLHRTSLGGQTFVYIITWELVGSGSLLTGLFSSKRTLMGNIHA